MARKNERTNTLIVAEVMEAGAEEKILKGKSFSITGHLAQPRNTIVQLIENAGGRFDKTPSWGTNYLITNADWNTGSTVESGRSKKLIAAQRNGTKIISEQQFLDMLTAPGSASA